MTFDFGLGAMQSPQMPAVYISKYNRFVDNIIGRINKILGKSYDPVRVKLQSNEAKKSKPASNKNKNTKTKRKNTKKRNNNIKRTAESNKIAGMTNKMAEISIARSTESESREPAFILISKNSDAKPTVRENVPVQRANTKNKKNNKNNKTKQTTSGKNKTQKARATLFGLSTITRDGDVSVNMQADHTTVKTNFILGPLTLRVEREVSI